MLKNKKKLVILFIVGYIIFLLGYTSFSVWGIAISFIGGMLVLILLLYLGIKLRDRKKIIATFLISMSIIGILSLLINSIFTFNVIMNR
jgi:hypothetical protein